MFEHRKLQNLEDYFKELNQRPEKGIYFYRINGYQEEIRLFLERYCEAARKTGVVIEGKIPNPEERNLNYYEEIMGKEFRMDTGFMEQSLRKWLPRMNDYQRKQVASSIYDTLAAMGREGKNDNILKNAYIKFLCWLYYRFERIVSRLGENEVPKILYDGTVSSYELKILNILAKAGSDLVLLQRNGDQDYCRLDPAGSLSEVLELPGMTAFPEGFGVRWLFSEMEKRWNREKLYGGGPQITACTNAWIEGTGLLDVLKNSSERGSDARFFYNCFLRIDGVEDKVTYLNDLYQFHLKILNEGRKLLILEGEIPPPTPEEIQKTQRKNYGNADQMLADLSGKIRCSGSGDLEKLMRRAFVEVLSEEEQTPGVNLNRLTNHAVYLLCWLERYRQELFGGWKFPMVGCFVHLGGLRSGKEAMFVKLLSRLPLDVVLLKPDRDAPCRLSDAHLYEIHYGQSMKISRFPKEGRDIRMGTAAYHAERELDEVMYQDSGMYRNQQYDRALSLSLQTMYEEISILWNQEVKYRPNFAVTDAVVSIPVLFAKVSGVKDGQINRYWSEIHTLVTPDTMVIRKAPHINPTDANPVKAHVTEFFKNGKLQKAKIKAHACYTYGFLREEMQDHILEKLQLLIDQRLIRGTFENGTEYTIISVVLNLEKEIVRLLQRFDFTKKNPKLIYIHTTETLISLEDSILTAFLNLAGFDVVFFVPTGYQSIEKHFNRIIMEEHQIGEYLYDLQVPSFKAAPSNTRRSWREIIFKRGS